MDTAIIVALMQDCILGDPRTTHAFLTRQKPWSKALDKQLCTMAGYAPLRNPRMGEVTRARNAYKKHSTTPPVVFFKQKLAEFDERTGDMNMCSQKIKTALTHYSRAHRLYGEMGDSERHCKLGSWLCHVRDQIYVSTSEESGESSSSPIEPPNEWGFFLENSRK